MSEELITIQITSPDAILFREFREHQNIFEILKEKGVFDIKYGKATLNFANGELQNVIKEEVVWHK